MTALDDARDLVRKYAFKESLAKFGQEDAGYIDEKARGWYWDGDRSRMFYEMNADTLATSLHAFIAIDGTSIKDERKAPLGISKMKGLPHLPKSMKWPKGTFFLAQIALDDVKKFDVEDLLPKSGILYFFMAEGDCKVLHFDGKSSELEVREYPEEKPENAEYYLDELLEASARIKFSPQYIFYAGGGDAYDYSPSASIIPKDLRAKLDAALTGFSLSKRDRSTRLFGRPQYWQGEDEDSRAKSKPKPPKNALLFHDEFGDGSIHIWVDRKAAAKRDYAKCWISYSGT